MISKTEIHFLMTNHEKSVRFLLRGQWGEKRAHCPEAQHDELSVTIHNKNN